MAIALTPGPLKRAIQELRRSNPVGYLFTLPYILFFAVFTAYPLGFAFYLTFHNWIGLTHTLQMKRVAEMGHGL